MLRERLLPAVPICVNEDLVVLDRYWVDRNAQFKHAFFELHDIFVVDARTFWEDQEWDVCFLDIVRVRSKALGHDFSVL
jgi:hypothetical protein